MNPVNAASKVPHPGTSRMVAVPPLRRITNGSHCHAMPEGMRVLAYTSAT